MNIAALALATSLLLAGCFGSSPTGPAAPGSSVPGSSVQDPGTKAPAVAPATGETVTGNGYSFVAPEGWTVPTGVAEPSGVDTFMANLADTDGFADNVNVVLSPAGEVTSEQVETQGVTELEGAGATDVTVGDRVTIAGSESAHLSAVFTSGAAVYQVEQFYASQSGQTYIVTFSFSTTVPVAERDAVTSSVLATWTWA